MVKISSLRKIHIMRCSGNRTTDTINRKKLQYTGILIAELSKNKIFSILSCKRQTRRQKRHITEKDKHCRNQI